MVVEAAVFLAGAAEEMAEAVAVAVAVALAAATVTVVWEALVAEAVAEVGKVVWEVETVACAAGGQEAVGVGVQAAAVRAVEAEETVEEA